MYSKCKTNHGYRSVFGIVLAVVICSGQNCVQPGQVLHGYGFATFKGLTTSDGKQIVNIAMLSGDGQAVVGQGLSPEELGPFIWKDGVARSLGQLPQTTNCAAYAISSDSSTVVGTCGHYGHNPVAEAFAWTAADGIVRIGESDHGDLLYPRAVSSDGSLIVGDTQTSAGASTANAALWTTQGEIGDLGTLPPGAAHTRAVDMSTDGSVIVGLALPEGAAGYPFLWTSDNGIVELAGPTGERIYARVVTVSADGTVVVGSAYFNSRLAAFRWTQAEGIVNLGFLFDEYPASGATGVSADGSIVVGFSAVTALGNSSIAEGDVPNNTGEVDEPFIWDEVHGMRNLRDVLMSNYGLNLSGWRLSRDVFISDDGHTLAGNGNNPQGHAQAWIAKLP